MQDICRFIGVRDNFKFNTETSHNSSYTPLSSKLESLIKLPNFFVSLARATLPAAVRQNISLTLRKLNTAKSSKGSPNLKEYENYFRSNIKKLEELIDRDLSVWLK